MTVVSTLLSFPVYQHPFVDVFKQAGIFDDRNSQAVGESSIVLDPQIGKRVLRMQGSISANNYVRIPHPTKKPTPAVPGTLITTHSQGTALKVALSNVQTMGLGLTGEYLYLQLRATQDEYFAFHLDVLTQEGPTIRLSFSNMFKSFKVAGQTLSFPCRIVTSKWTVFAMHLPSITRTYANSSFRALKAMQFCSSLFVRGAYTSDNHYLVKSLPREMQLPLPRDTLWMDVYDWVWLRPVPETAQPAQQPSSAPPSVRAMPARNSHLQLQPNVNLPTQATPRPNGPTAAAADLFMAHEPIEQVVSPTSPPAPATSNSNTPAPTAAPAAAPARKQSIPKLLVAGLPPAAPAPSLFPSPLMALSRVAAITPRIKGKNVCFDAAGSHLYYSAGPVVVAESLTDGVQAFLHGHTATITTLALAPCGLLATGQEGPLPLLRLWDTHSMPLPEPRLDAQQDPSLFRDRLSQLYTRRRQLMRAYRALTLQQGSAGCSDDAFGDVVRSAASVLGATTLTPSSTSQAAAAAVKALPVHGAAVCVASVVCDVRALHSVTFAQCSTRANMLMAVVGADEHNRPVICVYDIAPVLLRGATEAFSPSAVPILIARQVSEFPINRLRFHPSPSDQCLLVSVGQSNIRFWRLKHGHLPASSVLLNEHARQHFLDFDFEASYGDNDSTRKRMFVSTASGAVFQVHLDERRLECVYQLHNGPIYTLTVNEGFCITGSADGYLRVWPLDFSDYYLQALHPAPVVCGDVSADGLRVSAVTEAGAIGVMDLATSAYKTVLRSHTGAISALAASTSLPQFATAAVDGTIRVWCVHTMQQLYEFQCAASEVCTSVLFHDTQGMYRLICGFSSGVVRVIDIASTATIVKLRQHAGPVASLLVSPCGQWVYSHGYDGKLCVYDVSKRYQPARTCDTAALTALTDVPVTNVIAADTKGIRPPMVYPPTVIAGIKASRYPATSPAMAAAIAAPPAGAFPAALPTSQLTVSGGVPTVQQQLQLAPSMAVSGDGSLLAVTGESAHVVLLLDVLRLTEIFRLRTGARAIVKLAFHTHAPLPCCGQRQSAAEPAEELYVFFSDSAFARYSIPDCELLHLSVPKTGSVPARTAFVPPVTAADVGGMDSHRVAHISARGDLDPAQLHSLLNQHTNKGRKAINAAISTLNPASGNTVSSAHTVLARDHEWLQDLFSAANTYRLCTGGAVVGDWVLTTASNGSHGAIQVWAREGGNGASQVFAGPQPSTVALAVIPTHHFDADAVGNGCVCDCAQCMHIHSGSDAGVLVGNNADRHLPRGTQLVIAVGGNNIYRYYVGRGADVVEKQRERIITSQYEAVLAMADAADEPTAAPSAATAAQRLRAKVDAAIVRTAQTQATAAYAANTAAAAAGMLTEDAMYGQDSPVEEAYEEESVPNEAWREVGYGTSMQPARAWEAENPDSNFY